MAINLVNVGKVIGNPQTRILNNINLTIADGEFVSFVGRSGSGKSTLLYLLSSLDIASEGFVEIDGMKVSDLKPDDLYQFRNLKMGFIFQFHYLLAELTALENILMPARKTNQMKQKEGYALDLLNQFGLKGKEKRLPRQLSGGEQQRVAIARALIMKPKYIFADEPTGALDSVNAKIVIDIMTRVNQEQGTTVIMVTHDAGFAQLARKQIHLVDGKIV
ncbi:MAG: ABC transporter ATP-binding protein [Candidatus Omnitrophica bacterium]|nr:ABC transporter ATP-binding protein [Candidatus Omnitrophota bacterium]